MDSAATRCWCEYVNGKRHHADGCPTHPHVATPFPAVEEERDFWKAQAHVFEREAALLKGARRG